MSNLITNLIGKFEPESNLIVAEPEFELEPCDIAEEYESIMKNDVWEIVPRLEGQLVVTSKWIQKIKHVVDRSIEK